MVGPSGLEPPTSRLSGVRSNQLSYEPIKPTTLIQHKNGGDEEDRTPDPLRARQVLSQLSYTPKRQNLPLAPRNFEDQIRPSKLNNTKEENKMK